jgi:hypothetical protein
MNLGRADVDLKAAVDGIGAIVIAGKLDPLAAEKFVDLQVDVKGVELTAFSPYSGKFAGYELARGKLFLDAKAKLAGDKVDLTNLVTITQFTFGAATNNPQATKLPVRLGVALLKDREGKMVIDIPVQGSLNDPEFRVGRVALRVVVNLLTKAATSPFSLVGAMFGGGGEELAFQGFAPGSSALTPENLEKLATLTKALTDRPGLNLEIAGSFDPAADGLELKQRRFAQSVRTKLWEAQRAVDANVPPPDQFVAAPEAEAAIVKTLFDEKFPPGTPSGRPLAEPANVTPPPAPPQRSLIVRVVDAVTGRSRREGQAAVKKPASPTPPTAEAESAMVGPTLAEMKRQLVDAVDITEEDLRQLATARAQRVRDHFAQAQIANERLFLANVTGPGKGPRVFLQLQ